MPFLKVKIFWLFLNCQESTKQLSHWYFTSDSSNDQAVSPKGCWPWWQWKFHSSLITFCPVTRKGISQAIEWVAGWCGRHVENHNGARTVDTTEQRIRPVANVGYTAGLAVLDNQLMFCGETADRFTEWYVIALLPIGKQGRECGIQLDLAVLDHQLVSIRTNEWWNQLILLEKRNQLILLEKRNQLMLLEKHRLAFRRDSPLRYFR